MLLHDYFPEFHKYLSMVCAIFCIAISLILAFNKSARLYIYFTTDDKYNSFLTCLVYLIIIIFAIV